jgi:GT2 family glycosyltransferase
LLCPDNNIQHAGFEIGIVGVAGHVYKGYDKDAPNDYGKIQLIQNCEAVTAACLLIKKADFNAVGGFDEINLKVAFNDVDLCLKIR